MTDFGSLAGNAMCSKRKGTTVGEAASARGEKGLVGFFVDDDDDESLFPLAGRSRLCGVILLDVVASLAWSYY